MANEQKTAAKDVFQARKTFTTNGKTYHYYSLKALEDSGIGKVSKLALNTLGVTTPSVLESPICNCISAIASFVP